MRAHRFIPLLLISGITLLSLSSCKKKDDQNTRIDDVVYPSYSHMDSGNYWVYGQYLTDSSGNGTFTGSYDSCYVEKDTVIRGATWHKYIKQEIGQQGFSVTYFRDSLQYLVDAYGNIYFASQDFTTIFYHRYRLDPDHVISDQDTFALVEKKMADKDAATSVPAGTFTTSSMRTTWTLNSKLDPAQYLTPRRLDAQYSTSVGKVSEALTFYANLPTYTEIILLRYHLR